MILIRKWKKDGSFTECYADRHTERRYRAGYKLRKDIEFLEDQGPNEPLTPEEWERLNLENPDYGTW